MTFRSNFVPIRRSPEHKWIGGVTFTVEVMHDDVNRFGEDLLQEFPNGLFFPTKYHHGERYWGEEENAKAPVEFASSLRAAGEAHNSAESYFRVPWPEDLASGDVKRLIGTDGSSFYEDREHMRLRGRLLRCGWPYSELTKLHLKKTQLKVSHDCTIDLVGREFTVTVLYSKDDPEVLNFVRQVENLLLRFTSCDFASHDPCTGIIINENRRDASRRRTESVVRYASLNDRTYFGFCSKRGAECEVMGPRPEVRAAFRKEAGLES